MLNNLLRLAPGCIAWMTVLLPKLKAVIQLKLSDVQVLIHPAKAVAISFTFPLQENLLLNHSPFSYCVVAINVPTVSWVISSYAVNVSPFCNGSVISRIINALPVPGSLSANVDTDIASYPNNASLSTFPPISNKPGTNESLIVCKLLYLSLI